MPETDWAPPVTSPPTGAAPPAGPFAPQASAPLSSARAPASALRSLRTQLAWVFGGLTAVLVLVLSFVFGELLKSRIEREAGSALQVVSTSAAKQLSDVLFDHSRLVQALAHSSDLWRNGLNSPEVNAVFARIQLTRPYSVWLGVADPKGTVIHATGNQLVGRNQSDATWFTAGASAPYVSDVVPAKLMAPLLAPSASGEPQRLVDFSAPIRLDGQLIGVLGMHTSWDWAREVVQELLPTFSREDQIALFIFDRQGKLIFAPGGKLAPFIALDQTLPLLPKQLQADHHQPRVHASVVRWNDHSDGFLTTVAQLPARNAPSDLGWYVVARQPVASVYADARRQMLYVMGAGLLAAIIATWLVWWLSRHMVRELNTLAHTARRIDAGERQVPIPQLHSNREVQLLSQSFNAMTQRLLAANESMEHEVQMRTQELYDANRELDRQASTDPLTGLLNRRGFDAQVQFAMALARRSGRPLSLMTLDIDHFKQVNDNYGHEVGDLVLKSVANQLRSRLRDSDVIARFGGEEFVALLPDTPPEAAQRIAREILAAIENHQWPLVGRLTLSAGVTALRPTLQNGTEDTDVALLRRSDEALYQSKNAGRNQVHFVP